MFSYKQRYKPRTTREYTKSDLTMYDSAGNTALNALTIYGKSEVVDGAIKSAGEGWSTVDLGTLDWKYSNTRIAFNTPLADISKGEINKIKIKCGQYLTTDTIFSISEVPTKPNMSIFQQTNNEQIFIRNEAYTDATTFKAAMSGVLLCYELADPTQGNTIAVKTDNGTGVDGTMATFTTGTPLYGIDENTKDVMKWNGSTGAVTKNCSELDLGTPTWTRYRDLSIFYASISDIYIPTTPADRLFGLLCSQYSISDKVTATTMPNKSMLRADGLVYIRDDDYTDATAFKTALSGVMLIYELAAPTTEPLTQTENESLASLLTFATTTHFTNNADTDMTVNYTIKVPSIS